MARSLEYDVRVVVSFRVGEPRAGGRYRITERDVDAWAEVRFAESGWVPFFPAPEQEEGDRTTETVQEREAPPPEGDDPERAGFVPDSGGSGRGRSAGVGWQPWVVLALAAALAAVGAVPLLKRVVRARRRRAADPRRRVAAAWRETLERYADAGLPLTAATTTGEAAAGAAASAVTGNDHRVG